MKRNFVYIILSFLFMSWELQAHQPDYSSTVLMQQDDKSWILSIRAALTAFEYEIHNQFSDTSYTTPEGFQELVLEHMEENIEIVTNGDRVLKLENGVVRLGHETNVFFKVIGIPDNLSEVKITNTGFKNIYNNQSNVSIIKEGIEPNKNKISNDNNHTVDLLIEDTIVSVSNESVTTSYRDRKLFWALTAIPIILLGMLLLKLNFKKKWFKIELNNSF